MLAFLLSDILFVGKDTNKWWNHQIKNIFSSFMPLISFPYTFYFFSPFSYFFSLLLLFLFRLPLISFLPSCCINNGLISGKVLVDYRIKCSLTLLKSPFIDVEPRFSVYEWRFIDVERTFNVYERRFYLSINVSFLSWKNCFSRLKSLFYPSSYSHSFVFLLSFTRFVRVCHKLLRI